MRISQHSFGRHPIVIGLLDLGLADKYNSTRFRELKVKKVSGDTEKNILG